MKLYLTCVMRPTEAYLEACREFDRELDGELDREFGREFGREPWRVLSIELICRCYGACTEHTME